MKNGVNRLSNASTANPDPLSSNAGRLKAMYEIRKRAVGPFADDLSKAILGDYTREEMTE